jgi:hypothetical protein
MITATAKKFLSKVVLALALIACCVSCTNSLFVDSRDITQGEIGNFAVGMSKQQVLEIARQEHVHAIRPILNSPITYGYANSDALVSPGNGRSIELDGSYNLKVIYTIDKCKVIGIRLLGGASVPPSISVGNSSDDLIINLKKILVDDHAFSAHEVVSSDNESWFVIDRPQTKDVGSIGAYDMWSFEVASIKPAGAEFVVYFSEGLAVRISYKRPRIRLE